MIEYLYDSIKAESGADAVIAAHITDNEGNPVTEGCHLMLYDDVSLLDMYNGIYYADVEQWQFTIPAADTNGKQGRYWYCICEKANKLCFRQPIYFI